MFPRAVALGRAEAQSQARVESRWAKVSLSRKVLRPAKIVSHIGSMDVLYSGKGRLVWRIVSNDLSGSVMIGLHSACAHWKSERGKSYGATSKTCRTSVSNFSTSILEPITARRLESGDQTAP